MTARLRRQAWLTAVAVMTLGLLLAATAGAQTTIRMVPQADLKNTDPIWTTAAITGTHGWMIYDTLFGMNSNWEPQPQMVDSWEVSDDELTYTFTLRDGLMFHDGDPVEAGDAVASIERWGSRDSMGQKLMNQITAIEAVDADTFRIRLKNPYGLVETSLAKVGNNVPFIMKEELAGTIDAYTQITENIGSGPFRMVEEEWVPGNVVVYAKNEDYVPRDEPVDWFAGGKVVNVDRAEWVYIPDQATALAALRRGEVDFIEKPETDFIPIMESDDNIAVAPIPLIFQGMLQPNHLFPPFDHPKAREALLYMVKQEDYLQSIVGNDKYYWAFCGTYYACDTPYATETGSEKLRAFDLDKARQLMQESGYDGYPVVVMDPTDFPVLHGATLVTAERLRDIGVNVDLQAMDWSTLTTRRAQMKDPEEGGWNIFHTWTTSALTLNPASHNGITGKCEDAWFGWPCDERMAELSDGWVLLTDEQEKFDQAVALQARSFEVVPYVPFGQWTRPMAFRAELSGMVESPVAVLWGVSK